MRPSDINLFDKLEVIFETSRTRKERPFMPLTLQGRR
jgi:hypothetical protein